MNADDGLFFMNYKSFRQVFNKLFIAQDFPDEWWCVRYHSEWTQQCSGGLPKEGTAQANIRYAKNPQYIVYPTCEDIEIFVSLGQRDGRIKGEDDTYSKYPFKEKLITAHVAIWELDEGET